MEKAEFYELDCKDYATDQMFSRMNPVWLVAGFMIPTLKLDTVYGRGGRLPVHEVEESSLECFSSPRTLEEADWFAELKNWARILNLPLSRIKPGATVGRLTVERRSATVQDFMYPSPGDLIITERLKTLLEQSDFSGIEVVPVNVIWSSRVPKERRIPCKLFEILVTGTAWKKKSDGMHWKRYKGITLRGPDFDYKNLEVDTSTWDGSDFFHLDENSYRVFVTQRVKNVFEENDVPNCKFVPCVDSGNSKIVRTREADH